MRTSSTSGSEAPPGRGRSRWPLAGLLAAALLLAGDALLFGPDGPWQRLVSPDPHGTAATRLALKQLRAAPPGRPRVAVVGTSMVLDGFDPEVAARRMPGVHFAKLAHPRFEPFVLRAGVGQPLRGPHVLQLCHHLRQRRQERARHMNRFVKRGK